MLIIYFNFKKRVGGCSLIEEGKNKQFKKKGLETSICF